MMQSNNTWQDNPMLKLSLQFFAEGSGESGGEGASGTDASGTPAGGAQTDTTTSEQDFYEQLDQDGRNAFLKKHGLMHHKTAQARYKGSVDKAAKYDKTVAAFEALTERYGVSMEDPEALAKAVMNDPARIKAKAAELGTSDEIARGVVAAETAEAMSKAAANQRVRAEAYARSQTHEEEAKAAYPDFDLAKAGKNPAFKALYDSGNFSMKEAYELAFASELHAASIEAARNEARAAALAEYQANAGRPREGAAGGSSAGAVDKPDFSKMTIAQKEEYLKKFT